MSDLELIKRCAEKMGCTVFEECEANGSESVYFYATGEVYNPLTDDAQAMALVKRFRLDISSTQKGDGTPVGWAIWDSIGNNYGEFEDLNRAICECVARMP